MKALKKVFKNPRYVILASVISVLAFALAVWWPNFALIKQIWGNPQIFIGTKISLLFRFFGSISTNFHPFSIVTTVLIVVLLGINLSMLAYLIKKQKRVRKGGAISSFLGLLSSLFGVGCAACGTLIIGPALVALGAGGLLLALPLHGQEFALLGVFLLLYSIYTTSKQINKPLVCKKKK